jgi:hypothetical protein
MRDPTPPGDEADRARRDRALEWMRLRWSNPRKSCPICEVNDWTVEAVCELPRPPAANGAAGRSGLAVFPVVCANCGYTVFINSTRAGVTPPASPGR